MADWSEGVAVPSVPIQQFPAGKSFRHSQVVLVKKSVLRRSKMIVIICLDSVAAAPAVKTGEVFSGKQLIAMQ